MLNQCWVIHLICISNLLLDMSFITFNIEQFVQEKSDDDFNGYSPIKMSVIRKYFGEKTTVEIPVNPIVLDCGSYGEDFIDLVTRFMPSMAQSPSEFLTNFRCFRKNRLLRIDSVLIDVITKLDSDQTYEMGCGLYIKNVPTDYFDCVKIIECQGVELLEFNPDIRLRELVLDETINPDELREKLTELAFIGIVFKKIIDHFRE